MRKLWFIVLLCSGVVVAAQISYYNQQLLTKPSAAADRAFLGITGGGGTNAGPPGPVGPAGPAGANGANGTNGVNGSNGTNGLPGLNGTNGLSGTNGLPGLNGTNGTPGINGTNGVNGTNALVSGLTITQTVLTSTFTITNVYSNGLLIISGLYQTNYFDPLVADWASRVVAGGGASPSLITQTNLQTLITSLRVTNSLATNMLAKIYALNAFVPDSLVAAMTPLIKNVGPAIWTNYNFVAGDITTNGLLGNGSTKYINSGIIPNIFTNYQAGLTVYVPGTLANSTATIVGANYASGSDSAANASILQLLPDLSGTLYCDFPLDAASAARISVANTTGGYFSIDRTAQNLVTIYKANSSIGHTVVGTNTYNLGANYFSNYTTTPFFIQAFNKVGSPMQYSGNLISFAAFHMPFSASESTNFFNLIQTLRTNLGGGYL